MIVGDIIPRNAALRPDATAIVADGARRSFAEYAARCYRLANALIARGVARHERVAVFAQNCPEYLEVFGAGEVAGLVVNTVNFRLAGPELEFVLTNAEPAVVIFQAQYAEAVGALHDMLPDVRAFIRIGRPSARSATTPPICSTHRAPPGGPRARCWASARSS